MLNLNNFQFHNQFRKFLYILLAIFSHIERVLQIEVAIFICGVVTESGFTDTEAGDDCVLSCMYIFIFYLIFEVSDILNSQDERYLLFHEYFGHSFFFMEYDRYQLINMFRFAVALSYP